MYISKLEPQLVDPLKSLHRGVGRSVLQPDMTLKEERIIENERIGKFALVAARYYCKFKAVFRIRIRFVSIIIQPGFKLSAPRKRDNITIKY